MNEFLDDIKYSEYNNHKDDQSLLITGTLGGISISVLCDLNLPHDIGYKKAKRKIRKKFIKEFQHKKGKII